MDIQGKVVWAAKISILSFLIPNVNASTHSYLQVLWQFQSAKLYCDDVIVHCVFLLFIHR